ncbi:MAG: hypothetical protein GX442_20330 [Candidatus Riflebacteria bacterium]|nr:hypothetical protein [Candidatus Riflebacteria bacterium]
MDHRWRGGVTLLEIIIAFGVLGLGMIPVFRLLGDSRKITTVSKELTQAICMTSSMIDGLANARTQDLLGALDADLADGDLPVPLSLPTLGVPAAPPGLTRITRIRLINQPVLPGERFLNPWGRVLETHVRVCDTGPGAVAGKGKQVPAGLPGPVVYEARGFRLIDEQN